MQIYVLFVVTLLFPHFSYAIDTITQFTSVADGETFVSEGRSFELGFFSPGTSTNRYLGIWYKNIPVRTVVWVANRENPIKDNSSILTINMEGKLVIVNKNGNILWSATTQTKALNPILQLLDSGNLVLRDKESNDPKNYFWQSFDYPSDTLLPGMKLGWDLKTGLNRRLSSWKNGDDPSTAEFTTGLVVNSYPELVIWKNDAVYYRSGPWNGLKFSGAPAQKVNPLYEFKFVSNKDEVYYSYNLKNKSVISRVIMNQTVSARQRMTWIEESQSWKVYSSVPRDYCDNYNLCGPYGNCIMSESPVCQCLKGFKPQSLEEWNKMDWRKGCVHSEPWSCKKNKDGFVKFSGLKLPDTSKTWVDAAMTLDGCKGKCLENCSCTAFANSDVRGTGSGCVIWFGNLNDLRQISPAGQDLYIRMATSATPDDEARDGHRKLAAAVTIPIVLVLLVSFCFFYIYMRRRKSKGKEDESTQEVMELPFFDFVTIANATNDFSIDNKLGEGGFGPVYRGTLEDGQQIAVKRLSSSSGQGMNEFKNEVILCSKLQHRNLVKLLGCCIQGEEKMLIYEYMLNKSLDYFLFDITQSKLLDWTTRLHIIFGIARGLLYLHQDSRLRIIHRDLKASNILLDDQFNPKISDFGLAKMFGGDQIEGNTRRVVGTYGYMSPEYASDGAFSIKSDIFSFRVLVLEIISGKKNRGVYHTNQSLNLIGNTWRLWKEGSARELVDACLGNSFVVSEVLRCIHIGLLCVQQHPDDRPNMASVVVMLSSDSALPQPMEPGFLMEKASVEAESSSSKPIFSSTNEMSISHLAGR